MEHFHGDVDVVFEDVTLLKNHVRQVCSANHGTQANGRWPTTRYFNQGTGCGSSACPKKTQVKCMQQFIKERGDTPLCNVNRAEKGDDQGEVPTVAED